MEKHLHNKKVLLINEGWSDNLGDQAIRFTLENLLKTEGYDVTFQDFTRHKEKRYKSYDEELKSSSAKTDYSYKINKIIKCSIPSAFLKRVLWAVKNWRMFKLCSEKKYNAIIIGGGQLVNSNNVFSLSMYLWVSVAKIFTKSKVIIFAVGSINEFNSIDKFLYQRAFIRADDIYVRDYDTLKTLQDIFNVKAKYVPDVAFYIDKFYPNITNDPEYKENDVLVSLTSFIRYNKYNSDKTEEEYNKDLKIMIKEFIDKGNNVKLFYTTISDLVEAKKMQKIFQETFSIDLEIVKANNLDEFINMIARARTVISPRMHALIIAYVFGCEVIPLVISDKILSFKEHYLIQNVDIGNLQKQIKSCLQETMK